MPIENERKFVILETDSVEKKFAEEAEKTISIQQRYLVIDRGLSARVRSTKTRHEEKYYFTFKKDCGVPGEVIEIETVISLDDFNSLWLQGTNQVIKTRYIYEGWEVDFFKLGNHNYFAMAEIELPSGKKAPSIVPQLVLENLLYVVPIEDKRFSNKKISDVGYSISLLDSLKVKSGVINREPRILKKKYY